MPTRRVIQRRNNQVIHLKRRPMAKNAFHRWSRTRATPWMKKGRQRVTGKGWFDDLLGVAAMMDPTGLVRTGVIAKTALGLGRKKKKRIRKKPVKGAGFMSDMADAFSFVPGSQYAKMALQSVGLGKKRRTVRVNRRRRRK